MTFRPLVCPFWGDLQLRRSALTVVIWGKYQLFALTLHDVLLVHALLFLLFSATYPFALAPLMSAPPPG